MKKITLEYWLIALTLLSGFLSFLAIYRAVKVADASTWVVPMVWISFFVMSLFTITIFVRHKMEVEIVAVISCLMSLIFAFSLWHFLIIVGCIFLLLSGLADIRNDLDLNIKVSIWKSLYTGKFKIIFALSLLICSQYFFTIKNINGQIKIPKVDMSGIATKIAKPIFGEINPSFKLIADENLTVDQYILKSQDNNGQDPIMSLDFTQDDDLIAAQIPKQLPQAQQDALRQQALEMRTQAQLQLSEKNKQLILQEGRAQLSKVFGQQLNGNEMMADVIISPVGNTVNHYFELNVNGDNQSSIFPLVLTIVLFFILWPLGSLLSVLWFGVVILVFKAFLRFGLVKVERIPVEREMIV